jgi:hypothetical protein
VQALQVGNVPGDAEAHDLAFTVSGDLVDAGKAAQKQARPRGTIALTHDILTFLDDHNLHRQVFQRLPLVIREGEDALQFPDKWSFFWL